LFLFFLKYFVMEKKLEVFNLPPLPYQKDALKPYLSEETLTYHYEKHHRGYLNTLNEIVSQDPYRWMAEKTLDELVTILTPGKPFNMAAQVWNHTFYWESMSPRGGGEPQAELGSAIADTFGSFEKFKQQMTAEANSHFGSGWAWLIVNNEKKTPNCCHT